MSQQKAGLQAAPTAGAAAGRVQNRASSLVLEVAVAGGQQHHTVPGTGGGGGARQRGTGTSPNGTQCSATGWQQQQHAVPWLADPCAQTGEPHLLQQSMASWSRRLPPGCTMALTPAWGKGGTCSGAAEMRQQVGRLHSLWHCSKHRASHPGAPSVALQQAQGKPPRLLVFVIQACTGHAVNQRVRTWQAISTESFQEKGKKASEASTEPCA